MVKIQSLADLTSSLMIFTMHFVASSVMGHNLEFL